MVLGPCALSPYDYRLLNGNSASFAFNVIFLRSVSKWVWVSEWTKSAFFNIDAFCSDASHWHSHWFGFVLSLRSHSAAVQDIRYIFVEWNWNISLIAFDKCGLIYSTQLYSNQRQVHSEWNRRRGKDSVTHPEPQSRKKRNDNDNNREKEKKRRIHCHHWRLKSLNCRGRLLCERTSAALAACIIARNGNGSGVCAPQLRVDEESELRTETEAKKKTSSCNLITVGDVRRGTTTLKFNSIFRSGFSTSFSISIFTISFSRIRLSRFAFVHSSPFCAFFRNFLAFLFLSLVRSSSFWSRNVNCSLLHNATDTGTRFSFFFFSHSKRRSYYHFRDSMWYHFIYYYLCAPATGSHTQNDKSHRELENVTLAVRMKWSDLCNAQCALWWGDANGFAASKW